MRLIRTYRARYHARRALTLSIRAAEHGLECDRLLARSAGASGATDAAAARACPAGTILLAALIGMVICTVWIGLVARAAS